MKMMMLVAKLENDRDAIQFNPLAYFSWTDLCTLADLGGVVVVLREGLAYAMSPSLVKDWVRYARDRIKLREQNPDYLMGRCSLDVKLSTLSVGQGSFIAMLHDTLLTSTEPVIDCLPQQATKCKS
jgi:hypothetical protein